MSIQWTEDLATGVDEIDDQHRELFRRINALVDSCRQGRGKDEVKRVIWFLDDYVITHFSTEEKYMLKYNYPEYFNHKTQHLQFIENFSDLKEQFEKEGPGVHLVVGINHMIIDWLREHIRKPDKALGAFLKTMV